MATLQELEQKRREVLAAQAQAEVALAEIDAALAARSEMTDRERLAEELHDLKCTFSHEDQCFWEYEGDDWDSTAHKRWLDKADVILEDVTADEALKVIASLAKLNSF